MVAVSSCREPIHFRGLSQKREMRKLAHIGETLVYYFVYLCNTEGSRDGMIILHARKHQTLCLDERQRDILVGCILGDAYIAQRGKIQIEHCSAQKSYVDWKYEQLKSISYGEPKQVVRFDTRYQHETSSYRFWTRQFFRDWRARFYIERRKIVPEDLGEFSPLTMAIWYMDDGSLSEKHHMILSTDNFTDLERHHLIALLQTSFQVRSMRP
jgi:hypothetical protein